jgi:LPS sulfotransferase NodH
VIYWRGLVRRYVLLFQGRTGSSYLTELFWCDPRIRARGEHISVIRERGGGADEQLAGARGALMPPLFGRHAVVGFKVQLHEVLDTEAFADVLRAAKARVLYMQRRNKVKLTASELMGWRLFRATGKWNIHRDEDRLPPARVEVEEFRAAFDERERKEKRLAAFVRRLGLPTLEIFYEDLQKDEKGTLARVFGHFGLSPRPLKARMVKNNSDDLRAVLSNFDELRAAYAGTPHQAMFDEY